MKRIVLINMLILLIIVNYQTTAYSQYNPFTNAYQSSGSLNLNMTNVKVDTISELRNGISCAENSFFGINDSGTVQQFSLFGSTISFTSNIQTGGGFSLALCNNLNGGTFSPTLYSDYWYTNFLKYFNGVNWTDIPINTEAMNCGGNGNNLYYQGRNNSSVFIKKVYKYNGLSLTTIYYTQNRFIPIADLAVDASGNVWFATSADTMNFISESIVVLSSSGNIIKEFPFVYNCYNAYGSFILDSVFYIGLGPSNTSNPNTLIPITFTSDSAFAGLPINMPVSNYLDLESCNPGNPLLSLSKNNLIEYNIFPNPFSLQTTITFSKEQRNTTVRIINILGQVLTTIQFTGIQLLIDKAEMQAGIYYVQTIDKEKNVLNRKIIIE
jgi:hypothetical protein